MNEHESALLGDALNGLDLGVEEELGVDVSKNENGFPNIN
jgi:hypothetical protein